MNLITEKGWRIKNIRLGFVLFVLMAMAFFFPFATSSHAITITGSDTITTNSNATYTATGCSGSVSWSVTGPGASISQNGVLTTGSASCGAITITARCSDGSIATKTARVTNAGQWVFVTNTFYCSISFQRCTVETISGNTKEVFQYARGSLTESPPNCTVYGGGTCPPVGKPSCFADDCFYGNCCFYLELFSKYEWQCPSCTNGQTISCYTGTGGTQGVGICKAGTQTCTGGQWGACQGEVLPATEICDGKDNNCDGEIDEGLSTDADGDGHYTKDSCKTPNDDCNDGDATIYPGANEICDGKDNNCNGQTDEGFLLGTSCSVGVGACKRDGVKICSADKLSTVCNATPGTPSPEICDGIDNDCNGVIDDNLQPQKCYTGPQGTENVGECKAGTQTCTGGQWGACQGEITPVAEICGDGKDNNCNGQVDEGCAVCTDGQTKPCPYSGPPGTENVEVCKAGVQTCVNGQWGACEGEVLPTVEICDGKDNNCDGEKDEGACECSVDKPIYSSANIASGNLYHSQTLFTISNSKLLTDFTLSYNSLDSYNGVLGKGWTHTYNISLRQNNDGTYTVLEGDGRRVVLYQNGNYYTPETSSCPALIKNADGTYWLYHKDGISYIFNSIGKITSISDRNSNAITFSYDSNNNLTRITDPSGRNIYLSYDAFSRISAITDLNGNNYNFTYSNSALSNISTTTSLGTLNWSYTYDADAFMLSKIDPQGYTTTYLYDEGHRIEQATNPEGNTKTITYNPETTTSQITESNGAIWTYKYDTALGVLTEKTDPEGNATRYTYDQNKNLISTTDPDGSTTSYTYDSEGNMTSVTDAEGNITSYTYNSYGQVTSITDSEGKVTTYTYDEKGNLISTTDPSGATTIYEYDTKGNIIKITNPLNQTTTFTYDHDNNLASITDSTGATTRFTYDVVGNMTSQIDPQGNTTRFEYNNLNQLIKITDPQGNVTTYTYDKNGNRTSQTDGNGNTTYYEYNYKGQLTKVTDSLGNVTQYTYGGTGCASCGGGGGDKLTSVTDAKGQITIYQYDTLGRLIKETDPLGNAMAYSHDAKGNLISKTDANGDTITYTYDALNRLTRKLYPDGNREVFQYDAKGNIIYAGNQYIAYNITYDVKGRITTLTDSNSRTISYQYDSTGNRTKMTTPEGKTITYTYDTGKRLSRIGSDAGNFSFTYDTLGRRTKLLLPNSTYASYLYDNSGRLTSLFHKTSSGSTIASYAYTHDNVGNRLSKTMDTGTKYTYTYDTIYRLTEALFSSPGYSANTNVKGKGITTATQQQKEFYSYDSVGNRLTSEKTKTYIYNQANQLTANGGMYAYDRNGNLVSKIDGSTTFAYSYDYENHLTKVVKTENGTTTTAEFKYDPFGRRIEKKITENGVTTTTRYVYDNEDILFEYDEKGSIGNRYIHGPGIDEPLAVINGKNTYYYHADGVGSIVALSDSSGKAVQNYEYDSFGNLKDQKNRVKQPYTFTGREWDKEIGLYYLRARYYDPNAGRFITFDPILRGINFTENSCNNRLISIQFFAPKKSNPFVYTDNNPINFVDPKGLACGPGTIGDIVIPDSYFLWYTFNPACKEHDDCYGCKGEKAGKTKEKCDKEFFEYMNIICSTLPANSFKRTHCEGAAKTYYEAVRDNGDDAFRKAREECCK